VGEPTCPVLLKLFQVELLAARQFYTAIARIGAIENDLLAALRLRDHLALCAKVVAPILAISTLTPAALGALKVEVAHPVLSDLCSRLLRPSIFRSLKIDSFGFAKTYKDATKVIKIYKISAL
jgi:hypothetical protein